MDYQTAVRRHSCFLDMYSSEDKPQSILFLVEPISSKRVDGLEEKQKGRPCGPKLDETLRKKVVKLRERYEWGPNKIAGHLCHLGFTIDHNQAHLFKEHWSFIRYYNYTRPHEGINYLTPAEIYLKDSVQTFYLKKLRHL